MTRRWLIADRGQRPEVEVVAYLLRFGKYVDLLHLMVHVDTVVDAERTARALADETVKRDEFVQVVTALGLFDSVLSFDEIAAEFGRHERVLHERSSHGMTGFAALFAVVDLALFTHGNGVAFAACC